MTKDSDDNELPEIDSMLKNEIMEMQACPKCNSTKIMRDYECVEIVCIACGFVVDQKFADKMLEERAFKKEQKSKHARASATLTYTIHDKGVATVIDWHNRDSHENLSVNSQKTQGYHLRKWQRRVRVTGSTGHNLTYALSEITKISNKLNLSKNILETASVIYRKMVKEHPINGRSIRGIATATLYLSCRQNGQPITLDKIARDAAVNKKEAGKSYRFLIKKLDVSIPPIQPNQCITKFSNQRTIQRKVEEVTHKILTAAKDSKLTSGRNPTGIAAAAGYIALVLIGEHKTQKEIAHTTQTTEVTIKKRYKELANRLIFEISL